MDFEKSDLQKTVLEFWSYGAGCLIFHGTQLEPAREEMASDQIIDWIQLPSANPLMSSVLAYLSTAIHPGGAIPALRPSKLVLTPLEANDLVRHSD